MSALTLPRRRQHADRTEALDRLAWTVSTVFTCYGARIGVRANHAAVHERLLRHLPPGWTPARAPEVDQWYSLLLTDDDPTAAHTPRYRLYDGSRLVAQSTDIEQLLDTLESALHFTVALRARGWLFVHAGVVAWNDRAIVIPGRSMSGKTTLVAALVRAGATYYSDEYAVFDASGRVYPYAKPLSLRVSREEPRQKWSVELRGDAVGSNPVPVGLIAVTRYRPGACWQPALLSPGQAMLALLGNTVLARHEPALALHTFRHVAPTALAVAGQRGEADETVTSLLEQLDEWSTVESHNREQRGNGGGYGTGGTPGQPVSGTTGR
jgi:hypothetical protein